MRVKRKEANGRMDPALRVSGERGRRNGPLPKGNPYFSRLATSLVYSCMSPSVYPLLPLRQPFRSCAWRVGHVKLLGTMSSLEPRLAGWLLPQPRARGFVPHDPLV